METQNTPAVAPPLPPQRSAVAQPLPARRKVDGRTRAARRFRAALANICRELGKDFETLPETDRARVVMLAGLIVQVDQQAALLATGRAVAGDELVRVSGALSRALDDLGLSPEGLAARRAAEAEAERKRLLDQQFPNRTWDR
jgi:hypothetical protein